MYAFFVIYKINTAFVFVLQCHEE